MLFLTLIPSISPTHSDDSKSPLTVCTSLKSGKQFISKTGGCNERIYETRDWYGEGAVPTGTPGSRLIALNLCTSIKSQIRLIREKCNPRTQLSDTYQRSYGPPAAPLVPSATADLLGSAFLSFDEPEVDGGALISSYTITSTPGAITSLVAPKDINRAKITGLTPGVTYRFSITATNSQGTSLASPSSEAMLAPNLPDAPSITSLILTGDNSARLHYDQTKFDGGAAISSYKATITSSGIVVATRQLSPGVLELTGLPYSTTLSISLSARNIAGSSIASNASNSITTATPPPPPPPEPEPSPTPSSSAAPSPSAPAFTLSSSTEDVTVNTAATGFTITSTGGVIASFAISPAAPAGMSFNTSTGAFSGTPTATQSATTYTITATNATGSATQTFSFTVSAVVTYAVGDTGPGGGTIIYVSASGFNCGPEFSATGSPAGGKCHYLEVAPKGWNGLTSDSMTVWGNVNVNISGIQDDTSVYNNDLGVGLGYRNSELIVAQNGTYDASSNKYAAGEARAYAGGGKNDWYLPTSAELNLMCQWAKQILPNVAVRCSGGSSASTRGFQQNIYWSSSEQGTTPRNNIFYRIWAQTFSTGDQTWDHLISSALYVRPVRSF